MPAYVYTLWPSTRRCREASSLFQDFWTPPAPHFGTSPFLAPNIPLTIGGWRFWSREKSRAADEIKKKKNVFGGWEKVSSLISKMDAILFVSRIFQFWSVYCLLMKTLQSPPDLHPTNDRRRWCVPRFHGGNQYAMSNVHVSAFTHTHTNIYMYAWIYTT